MNLIGDFEARAVGCAHDDVCMANCLFFTEISNSRQTGPFPHWQEDGQSQPSGLLVIEVELLRFQETPLAIGRVNDVA